MVRVTILGAAGGIGQPLSLLMKLNQNVTELRLVDVAPLVRGVAADLSHIPTKAKVTYFQGDPRPGLEGAQLVLIPAGVPRKPGMTRDDLFNVNAGIVKGIAEAVAERCPDAFVGLITNPVNSTVPIFVEAFRATGKTVDPKRIFGVTTLDVLRAKTFAAQVAEVDPATLDIPVVGGHAGTTIVPLFSQTKPAIVLSAEQIIALTKRTQDGGTEVVEAKDGAGSATLSMAQAGAVFAEAMITAIGGGKASICAYVGENPTYAEQGVSYFSQELIVGASGVEAFVPLGTMSAAEEAAVTASLTELKASIEKGVTFATAPKN